MAGQAWHHLSSTLNTFSAGAAPVHGGQPEPGPPGGAAGLQPAAVRVLPGREAAAAHLHAQRHVGRRRAGAAGRCHGAARCASLSRVGLWFGE